MTVDLHRGLPAVAVLALALAGCASTGGLAPRERVTDPDTLAAARSLATSTADFPTPTWWTALGDRQLDALVAEALAQAPTLAQADARMRQAQAAVLQADATRRPTLSASAQVTGVQLPGTLVPPPIGGQFNASDVLLLDFKWAPDLWGGQRARYEAAVGQARAAEVDAQAARVALADAVVRTYVQLAQAHDALGVAEREQARATRLRDLGRQRVRAGLDNQLQLRQADVLVATAAQQAQAARQSIEALRNALAALAGQGPDRGQAITPPRLGTAPAPGVPSVLPSELLGHRADVVAARWRVEAAARGVDAAQAAFKPSVNLTALVGLASGGLSDLFSSDAVLGFGGPAISLPIFDGGRRRGVLARSDADYDLAVSTYNATLVDALRQVTDAVQAARALDAQIATATQARDAAQAALSLATTRYRAGLSTQLDVLAAQRPLLQADQLLAGLRAQRLLAVAALDTALGGGLPLPAAPAPPSTRT